MPRIHLSHCITAMDIIDMDPRPSAPAAPDRKEVAPASAGVGMPSGASPRSSGWASAAQHGRKHSHRDETQRLPCSIGAWITVALVVGSFITACVLIGVSLHGTDENQACLPVNSYSGEVGAALTTPTYGFFGPWASFACISTSLDMLPFTADAEGLHRSIACRTKSGLRLNINLEVEYRLDATAVREILLQSPITTPPHGAGRFQLLVATRSSIRNTAAAYEASDFLRGDLSVVADHMRNDLQVAVGDLGVTIERINIDTIPFDAAFEAAFEAVENMRLSTLRLEVESDLRLGEEVRTTETMRIQSLSDRERRVQAAHTAQQAARLDQTAQVTQQNTETQRLAIEIAADRANRIIAAQAVVREANATRELQVQEALRATTVAIETAETQRIGVLAEANAAARVANATVQADILRANVAFQERVEALAIRRVQVGLALFSRELDMNVTLRERAFNGTVAATDASMAVLPDAQRHQGLLDSVGMSVDQAVATIWHMKMRHSDAKAFLDYDRKPFTFEVAPDAGARVMEGVSPRSDIG